MNDPKVPARAPTRATVALLSAGSLLSAAAFLVAILLVLAGRPGSGGPALDPLAALAGLVSLDPHAWASVGVLILLATPVAGLLATTAEYWGPDRRLAGVAVLVLAILAASLAIAWLR